MPIRTGCVIYPPLLDRSEVAHRVCPSAPCAGDIEFETKMKSYCATGICCDSLGKPRRASVRGRIRKAVGQSHRVDCRFLDQAGSECASKE